MYRSKFLSLAIVLTLALLVGCAAPAAASAAERLQRHLPQRTPKSSRCL